jgi:hypothetical protein
MGISNTTYITCDAIIKGQPCKKRFALPDPPEQNTLGVENVVSLTIGAENKGYYFCSMEHMLKFGVDYVNATKESRAYVAMEELESIPQTPENFDLDSN